VSLGCGLAGFGSVWWRGGVLWGHIRISHPEMLLGVAACHSVLGGYRRLHRRRSHGPGSLVDLLTGLCDGEEHDAVVKHGLGVGGVIDTII
jgi:hypothetical protein